jgi:hypothetical protein
VSTPRSSGGTHAGHPLVVDVRSLPPLEIKMPPPVRAHDAGRLPSFGAEPPASTRPAAPSATRRGAAFEAHAHREPTFDELVHGFGRHRGDEQPARRGPLARLIRRPRRGPARRA